MKVKTLIEHTATVEIQVPRYLMVYTSYRLEAQTEPYPQQTLTISAKSKESEIAAQEAVENFIADLNELAGL